MSAWQHWHTRSPELRVMSFEFSLMLSYFAQSRNDRRGLLRIALLNEVRQVADLQADFRHSQVGRKCAIEQPWVAVVGLEPGQIDIRAGPAQVGKIEDRRTALKLAEIDHAAQLEIVVDKQVPRQKVAVAQYRLFVCKQHLAVFEHP